LGRETRRFLFGKHDDGNAVDVITDLSGAAREV
jgi:hypothetical protein